jgi:hypothetical protein
VRDTASRFHDDASSRYHVDDDFDDDDDVHDQYDAGARYDDYDVHDQYDAGARYDDHHDVDHDDIDIHDHQHDARADRRMLLEPWKLLRNHLDRLQGRLPRRRHHVR